MRIDAAAQLALYRTKALTAYSEDQLRDSHGRWTKGGDLADKGDDTTVRISDLIPKGTSLNKSH